MPYVEPCYGGFWKLPAGFVLGYSAPICSVCGKTSSEHEVFVAEGGRIVQLEAVMVDGVILASEGDYIADVEVKPDGTFIISNIREKAPKDG